MRNPGAWIEGLIRDFSNSEENSLQNRAGEEAWATPLVGFSRGDDPLYAFFKEDIGTFFWTPQEAFSLAFPDSEARAGELSVISWVLPQTGATRDDNRREARLPAERWARSRNFGEAFNLKLARGLSEKMLEAGIQAVAPAQLPGWSWQESAKYGISSSWSERHAAYASGLGTFSLCDGLITRQGKAMRCGSVVARLDIPPTPRTYDSYRAWCLFFKTGKCRKCISRCPCGAITENGHDKAKCKAYLFETVAPYAEKHFGFASYGCGLCQTGVPCEEGIPGETEN